MQGFLQPLSHPLLNLFSPLKLLHAYVESWSLKLDLHCTNDRRLRELIILLYYPVFVAAPHHWFPFALEVDQLLLVVSSNTGKFVEDVFDDGVGQLLLQLRVLQGYQLAHGFEAVVRTQVQPLYSTIVHFSFYYWNDVGCCRPEAHNQASVSR